MLPFRFLRDSVKSRSTVRPLVAQKPAAIIESVEPRVMLSGDITASLNANGHLKLLGDAEGNDLVAIIAADGSVSFTSNSTTVNGQTAEDVNLAGTVNSISGSLGDGADSLVIQGETGAVPVIDRNVVIRLGAGGDSFTLRGLDVGGRVYIGGDGDNDIITIEAVDADGELIAAGNREADTVSVRYINTGTNVRVRGGGEVDTLTVGERVEGPDSDAVSTDGSTRNDSDTELILSAESTTAQRTQISQRFSTNPHQAESDSDFNERLGDIFGLDPQDFSFTPATAFPTGFPDYDPAEFQSTASGLQFRIIDAGTGGTPTTSDTVSVDYQGLLPTDGSQFDSSYDRGEASSFGVTQVIAGWTEGLQLIAEGGRIQLLIPDYLAYSSQTRTGIPAYSPLFFNVELISIA